MKLKVGIIGCGTIGSRLAKFIDESLDKEAVVSVLCDTDINKAKKLSAEIKSKPKTADIQELINESSLVIEAASASVSAQALKASIAAKKDIMIMSVGGLLGNENLLEEAKKGNIRVYIPSGAIGGIDTVKAAGQAKIKSAKLITRKPPQGFKGAPYVIENKIDLDTIKQEKVLFEGTAKEAIKGFPANINVSAVLSLASIGAEKVRVVIMACPDSKANTHQVQLEGDFGKLTTITENVPCPDNPKTSYLAILSAIATLKQIFSSIKIGT